MNSRPLTGPVAPSSAIKKQITKFEQAEHVHRQLLYDLMSSIYEYMLVLTANAQNNNETSATTTTTTTITATTTETRFKTNEAHTSSDNNRLTPNIESLLLHIHSCLEQIFLNGLRIFKPDVSIAFVSIVDVATLRIASSDLRIFKHCKLVNGKTILIIYSVNS